MRSHLHVVALAFFASCSRDPRSTSSSVPLQASAVATSSTSGLNTWGLESPSASLAPDPMPATVVFPSSTVPSPNAPLADQDIVHRQLRTAPIQGLKVVSWSKPGLFDATLDPPHSDAAVHVTLALALDEHPIAHRRPLAFARLARELGTGIVPATVVRRVSTGELGVFNEPDVRAYLTAHAAVQNDGTIDALLVAPSRGNLPRAWNVISRRDIVLDEAPEARAWARWAASSEPLADENASLLREYVEALVLDYLACNIMRRSVLLDESSSELMLAENDGAFPPKISPGAEARLLDRLRPVVRFPRSIRDALTRLDRSRAREIFMAGAFETWLVAPRTLMTLDERRITLLTLIESRIAAYGERVVLSL